MLKVRQPWVGTQSFEVAVPLSSHLQGSALYGGAVSNLCLW